MKHAHSGPIRVQAEAPGEHNVTELLRQESLHLFLKLRVTSERAHVTADLHLYVSTYDFVSRDHFSLLPQGA